MRTVLLLALLALARSASAQESPGDGAGPDAPPALGAALSPDPALEEEARTRFRQGLVLARGGDCAAALAELEASYRLLPRPNTLFNMA